MVGTIQYSYINDKHQDTYKIIQYSYLFLWEIVLLNKQDDPFLHI